MCVCDTYRASGYCRLSDVTEDFVALNAVSIPKPIIFDTVAEEIDISSDGPDNEGLK